PLWLDVTAPRWKMFLLDIHSNDAQSLKPRQGRRASRMDVKGRQLAFMRVLVRTNEILLELPADRLGPVEQALVHYRVAAPVRFEPRAVSVLALLGPQARATLGRRGCEL